MTYEVTVFDLRCLNIGSSYITDMQELGVK